MKALVGLIFICCIFGACTLVGYDRLAVDSGSDSSQPRDGEAEFDSSLPRDHDGGAGLDASSFDAGDAGSVTDSAIDSSLDASQTKDGAIHDASGKDAAQEDAGSL
jgi:hypothetical protein